MKQREAHNKQSLICKLDASVMSKDILNNLFDNFEIQNAAKRRPGFLKDLNY